YIRDVPSLLLCWSDSARHLRALHSFPTRRSSDLSNRPSAQPSRIERAQRGNRLSSQPSARGVARSRSHGSGPRSRPLAIRRSTRSEEHTSELQSRENLVCRLLLEKKKKKRTQCKT